jgi:hypothetical protein
MESSTFVGYSESARSGRHLSASTICSVPKLIVLPIYKRTAAFCSCFRCAFSLRGCG